MTPAESAQLARIHEAVPKLTLAIVAAREEESARYGGFLGAMGEMSAATRDATKAIIQQTEVMQALVDRLRDKRNGAHSSHADLSSYVEDPDTGVRSRAVEATMKQVELAKAREIVAAKQAETDALNAEALKRKHAAEVLTGWFRIAKLVAGTLVVLGAVVVGILHGWSVWVQMATHK